MLDADMLTPSHPTLPTIHSFPTLQVESKELEIALLRKRNAQYAAVLRHFQRVEKDYKSLVEQLVEELEEKRLPRAAPTFSTLPENLRYVDKDIREAVERPVAPIDFDNALAQMDALVKQREAEVAELRHLRAKAERDAASCKQQLAEADELIADLRKAQDRQAQVSPAVGSLASEMQQQ
jgi:hypothetical protein